METSQENLDIYNKYLQVINELEVVKKDKENPFAKSYYATLTNIIKVVQPLLIKRGLILLFQFPKLDNDIYEVKASLIDVTNTEESKEDARMEWTFAVPHDTTQKNPTQGFGSTMTYAQRYGYAIIFQIPFDDQDPDASKKPGTNAVTKEPKGKPWLNKGTTQFAEAVKYIEGGGKVADIKKKYKISKTEEATLQAKVPGDQKAK